MKSLFTVGKGREPFYKNIEFVRKAGAESMVLLKNNGILPMETGRIALFGAGAIDTIFCGNYTNYVWNPNKVSIYEGLKKGGFTFSSESWLSKMKKEVAATAKSAKNLTVRERTSEGLYRHAEEVAISEADLAESVIRTNTCIYALRRVTVENADREYAPGDFLLSEIEQENLKKITDSFENVILVLNSGILEIGQLVRDKKIKAIVYMGIPGMEAGNSLFDIITGAVNPCGHLSDTWAKKYKDYPASASFSKKARELDEVNYNEDIYLGYRYFDTFEVPVLFPFGFGMSYTSFRIDLTYFEANWFHIILKLRIRNEGKTAGRCVPQVYVTAPEGTISKPLQELRAFEKTRLLSPGTSEEIKIQIPTEYLSNFSEKRNAWVMDRGEYLFRVGENSKDTRVVARLTLNKQTIFKKVASVIAPKVELQRLEAIPRAHEVIGEVKEARLNGDELCTHMASTKLMDTVTTYVYEGSNYKSFIGRNPFKIPFACKEKIEYVRPISTRSLLEVINGVTTMEEFVASLSPEVLARIVAGDWDESLKETEGRLDFKLKPRKWLYKCGRSTSQFATTLGIPGLNFCDGPAGLHLYERVSTCYPSATNLAQTFDKGLMYEIGDRLGEEMEYFDIDFLLAPAINIHRDPMAGRMYEFFSEDPCVTGRLSAEIIRGVQSHSGRGVVVKHFANYNREQNKRTTNCNISCRALREIYLRAFEICIRTAKPKGVMNSHNKLNGDYTSSLRGLNMDILRQEWGFEGFVMSEWGSLSDKAYDIHAGCDLIMPGYNPDKILQAMMSVSPTFAEDGYVYETTRTTNYETKLIVFDSWGSFLPDKEGKDTIFTSVAPEVDINPKVFELKEKGICEITKGENGAKIICYHGTDRGAYLTLGDLQACVIHILNTIRDTNAMDSILEQSKKNKFRKMGI